MYTFNPETLEKDVENFNHKDFSKNKIKYDKLEKLTDFKNGGDLMIARAPKIDKKTGGCNGMSHSYLISTLGAEFGRIDDVEKFKQELFKINGKLMRLDCGRVTLNADKEKYYQPLWEEFKTMLYAHLCLPIVEASAKELDLINYIPDGIFVEYPEINQEITATMMCLLAKQFSKNNKLNVQEQKKDLIENLKEMKKDFKTQFNQLGSDE